MLGSTMKMGKAKQRIHDRFAEIEAALSDLEPSAIGVKPVQDLGNDGLIQRRYRNRLQGAFLLLYHLQDDVKRFAKKTGKPKNVIDEFADKSLWVKLCIRAGNTHKHGLGGRSKNATVINGLLYVVKMEPNQQPTPNSDAIVIGMAVADAEYGTFPSQRILQGAIQDWVQFLAAEFELDLSVWLSRCIPKSDGPAIELKPGTKPTVPLGSTVTFELPENFRKIAQEDAAKRRDGT